MSHKRTPSDCEIPWPQIQEAYVDEFGLIDPDIHQFAGRLWSLACRLSLRRINDAETGQTLLIKAVALVSRKTAEAPERITLLRPYLFRTFTRLLEEERKKRAAEVNNFDDEDPIELITRTDEELYRTMLLHEILQRADEKFRQILEQRMLGYSFEVIAPNYGMRANHLRSFCNKQISKLQRQIVKETRAAEQRILARYRKSKS
jgi:DNA-directed RNA polymerase specialized sigma24 family protein